MVLEASTTTATRGIGAAEALRRRRRGERAATETHRLKVWKTLESEKKRLRLAASDPMLDQATSASGSRRLGRTVGRAATSLGTARVAGAATACSTRREKARCSA